MKPKSFHINEVNIFSISRLVCNFVCVKRFLNLLRKFFELLFLQYLYILLAALENPHTQSTR